MNTRQYYYLSAIAEYGSLSRAAQALGLSPSALSKFLAECEHLFGTELFVRRGRRLYPAAAGQYVVECAQKILDEQNRMLLTMREVSGSGCSFIRLATSPNRGAAIYSRVCLPFSRRYPDIALHLVELFGAEQAAAVARGTVDLALGTGEPCPDTVDLPVTQEEVFVALPSSHPLAALQSVRLEALQDTPFILQGTQHSLRILADRLFAQAGFQPVVTFESGNVFLIEAMLRQAVGAGFVSRSHIFNCPEAVCRPLDPPVWQTLHLRCPLGHTLTAPERYLAGLLLRECRADPCCQPVENELASQLLQDISGETASLCAPSAPPGASGTFLQETPRISLDTRVLEYIIAIVEEQSLSGAADRFLLAQPALSRHLRSVEAMLGMPLFSREHNRLRPTSAGTVFVNNARNILRIENEMFARVRSGDFGHQE